MTIASVCQNFLVVGDNTDHRHIPASNGGSFAATLQSTAALD